MQYFVFNPHCMHKFKKKYLPNAIDTKILLQCLNKCHIKYPIISCRDDKI